MIWQILLAGVVLYGVLTPFLRDIEKMCKRVICTALAPALVSVLRNHHFDLELRKE